MNKVHTYKRHTITLEAEWGETGWICKFTMVPFDPQDERTHSAYTRSECDTEEKAALETAQSWIDNVPG